MACPVNSPFYQALLIFLGVLIVVARHVKGAQLPIAPAMPHIASFAAAAGSHAAASVAGSI